MTAEDHIQRFVAVLEKLEQLTLPLYQVHEERTLLNFKFTMFSVLLFLKTC
jgi:hypothetical protein